MRNNKISDEVSKQRQIRIERAGKITEWQIEKQQNALVIAKFERSLLIMDVKPWDSRLQMMIEHYNELGAEIGSGYNKQDLMAPTVEWMATQLHVSDELKIKSAKESLFEEIMPTDNILVEFIKLYPNLAAVLMLVVLMLASILILASWTWFFGPVIVLGVVIAMWWVSIKYFKNLTAKNK